MKNPENHQSDQSKIFLWNVVAGVVASVVVIAFIQPILTLLWDFLTSTSSSVLNSLADTLYKNAALGDRNWVAVGMALIALNVPMVAAFLVTFGGFKRRIGGGISPGNSGYSSVARRVVHTLLALIGVPCVLYLSISIFTDLQLNSSFNQRMSILAARLPDQQIKMLRADWATMTSKVDHRHIVIKMEAFAAQEHVKLPPLLLSD